MSSKEAREREGHVRSEGKGRKEGKMRVGGKGGRENVGKYGMQSVGKGLLTALRSQSQFHSVYTQQ